MSDNVEPISPRRRPPGLGRGLSALLGDTSPSDMSRSDGIREIAIADITPHPGQPRRHFDEGALIELAESIASRGVLQPIVVRPAGDRYQIVAGERRWRAAQRAQLHTIPAIVRSFDEAATLEVALIENIQREQLNAVEEGEAYRRLIDEHGHTQDALAKLLHKSRSHIANLMRLMDLPESVRSMVADGRLTMGHARALIGAADAEGLAAQIIKEDLSVRAAEALVKKTKKPAPIEYKSMPERGSNADIELLERQLGDLLGLKVGITHKAGAGSVNVSYATLDQLDMICQRLSGGSV
ncbi:MAG: ParB/RepB/Spo0J family partition protein [Sphingomonadales bacterium]